MNQGFEIGTSGYPAGVGDYSGASGGGGIADLFRNPQFQSLLAGIGARLDPQGVGGALGGATQEYIKSKAALSSATDIQEQANRRHRQLMAALVSRHTPAGAPGPTSTTYSANKIVEKGNRGNIEYTETTPVPAALESVAPAQAPSDYSTAVPASLPPVTTSPVSSSAPTKGVPLTQSMAPREFYPFFQALRA